MIEYMKRLYKNVEKSKRLGDMNDVGILTTKIKRLGIYTAFISVVEIGDVTRFPTYKYDKKIMTI